jgi:hypothetical protein
VTGVRIARAGKLEKRQNTQWKKEKERKKEEQNGIPIWRLSGSAQ